MTSSINSPDCICYDTSLTKQETCYRCKSVWTMEAGILDRRNRCPVHSAKFPYSPDPELCQRCIEEGWILKFGPFQGMKPQIVMK